MMKVIPVCMKGRKPMSKPENDHSEGIKHRDDDNTNCTGDRGLQSVIVIRGQMIVGIDKGNRQEGKDQADHQGARVSHENLGRLPVKK